MDPGSHTAGSMPLSCFPLLLRSLPHILEFISFFISVHYFNVFLFVFHCRYLFYQLVYVSVLLLFSVDYVCVSLDMRLPHLFGSLSVLRRRMFRIREMEQGNKKTIFPVCSSAFSEWILVSYSLGEHGNLMVSFM